MYVYNNLQCAVAVDLHSSSIKLYRWKFVSLGTVLKLDLTDKFLTVIQMYSISKRELNWSFLATLEYSNIYTYVCVCFFCIKPIHSGKGYGITIDLIWDYYTVISDRVKETSQNSFTTWGQHYLNQCQWDILSAAGSRGWSPWLSFSFLKTVTVPVAIYDSFLPCPFFYSTHIPMFTVLDPLLEFTNHLLFIDANLHYVFNHCCVCSSFSGGLHASGQIWS